MSNSKIKVSAFIVGLITLSGCGNKEAELQARCTSEGNSTYTQAMAGVKLTTDEGSIANRIAKVAAEQAQAYTFTECMKRR